MDAVAWLLHSDPAIAWQAVRDLTSADEAEIATARARVPREGLGAQILALQEADGAWRRPEGTSTWLPTLFTLLLLRATGADPADPAIESAVWRLESSLGWDSAAGPWDLRPAGSGAAPFFEGEVEPCINGGVLALGGYFGRPTETLARRLMSEQLPDGGWNCEAPKSVHSSFHTTICVLEGLLEYERAAGPTAEVIASRRRGETYLLERALFRRRSTGDVANPEFLEFAFPPRYHYDVLRGLDYFRNAGAEPDARMADAVDIVEGKRQPDGRWLLEKAYTEALPLPAIDTPEQPSLWNTLRALRVLQWYDAPSIDGR